MKKRIKAVIILMIFLLLVAGSVLYFVLRPENWSDEFVKYVNENILQDHGWELSLGNVSGTITSELHLKNIYLKKDDGSVVLYSENSLIKLNFIQILSGRWAIDEFSLDNVIVTVKSSQNSDGDFDLNFISLLTDHNFSINWIKVVNTSVIIQDNQNEHLYILNFSGHIESQDQEIIFSPQTFYLSDIQDNRFISVNSGNVILEKSSISMEEIAGLFNKTPFQVSGQLFIEPDPRVSLDVTINDINPSEILPAYASYLFDSNLISLNIQIDTDFEQMNIVGEVLSEPDNSNLAYVSVDITRSEKDWYVNHGNIRFKSMVLNGQGALLSDGNFQLNMEVSDLDLKEFDLIEKSTQFKGTVHLSGNFDKAHIGHLFGSIDLKQGVKDSKEYVAVIGDIIFENNIIRIGDSLKLDLGKGKLLAEGKIDLAKERIDVSLRSLGGDLNSLLPIIGIDSLLGKVEGSVDITGFLDNPTITGYFLVTDAEYKELSVNTLQISFHMVPAKEKRYGSFRILTSSGHFMDYPIDRGVFDLYLRGDTLQIANARLENDQDYLQISGKVIGSKTIIIDQFQLAFMDQYVTNLSEIEFHQEKNHFVLQPTEIKINEGKIKIALQVSEKGVDDIEIVMTNLNLSALQKIIGKGFPLSGAAFGHAELHSISQGFKGKASFELKDGHLGTVDFERLLFSAEINKDLFTIDEFRIVGHDNSMTFGLSGYGHVVMENNGIFFTVNPEELISISSEFKHFDISHFQPYVPKSWNLDGSATGSFTFFGVANDPEINYEFTISSLNFHRIKAESLSGSGRYTDKRLYFEDLVGITSSGQYTGSGYLPVDFSIGTNVESRFLSSDPISFRIESSTTQLEFLIPYFDDIDVISGNFEIELSISGTPDDPIRNGKIKITDAQIYAALLEHPISNLNGSAVLSNNKFIILELQGSSYLPPNATWTGRMKKNLAEASGGLIFKETITKPASNISLKGSMDMTEFFKPNLAFVLSGQDVYIRTLLGEIEGIADIDLSITGKDTINVAGEIIPKPNEVMLRIEFATGEEYEEVVESSGVVTNYTLHFPIEGNFFIRNSQVDVELYGDMTIFKVGNGSYRYSGELNVSRGKFYYLSDVFEILEGSLLFEPSEFNPKLDIHAKTEIDGTVIHVSLSGDLKEPILLIEDTEQFYSQSDLLQLLTFQKRLEEQDLTSEGLRVQSLSLFGKIIENELEKSMVRVSPLDEFEIEGATNLLSSSGPTDLSLKFGKQVLPNLYLSYKKSFSLTQPYQLGIEYRLSRNVSLVGNYDEAGLPELKYRLKYQY